MSAPLPAEPLVDPIAAPTAWGCLSWIQFRALHPRDERRPPSPLYSWEREGERAGFDEPRRRRATGPSPLPPPQSTGAREDTADEQQRPHTVSGFGSRV